MKFSYINLYHSIDATNSIRLGKFVNDSPKPNSKMKVVLVNDEKRICLFASKRISFGEEIRYDYHADNLWWRSEVWNIFIIFFP